MSAPQHTPAPWVWSGGQLLSDQRAKMYSETVLVVHDDKFLPSAEDARLIAAAPDLLEACKALVKGRPTGPVPPQGTVARRNHDLWQQARAAIRKATAGDA